MSRCFSTSSGATARKNKKAFGAYVLDVFLDPSADGLADCTCENGSERCGGQHKGASRSIVKRVTQASADDATDSDSRDGLGNPTRYSAGAFVVLGQRPHAFRTSSHLEHYRSNSAGNVT